MEYKDRQSIYLPSLAIIFYMLLLSSSIAGQKLISVFGVVFSAGNIFFQVTYMIIACVTELYGLKQAKLIIFTGAFCNLLVSYYLYLVIQIPSADFWPNQDVFSKVTLTTVDILFTSTVAYVASEIVNAKTLSHLKLFYKNIWFPLRAILSTSTSSIVDSIFMLPIIIKHSPSKVFDVFYSLLFIKLIYSFVLIPILWIVVEILKKKDVALSNTHCSSLFSSVTYLKEDV